VVALPVEWKARVFRFLSGLELSHQPQPTHLASGLRENGIRDSKDSMGLTVSGKVPTQKDYTPAFVTFIAENLEEVVSANTSRSSIRDLLSKFFAGIGNLDISSNQTL